MLLYNFSSFFLYEIAFLFRFFFVVHTKLEELMVPGGNMKAVTSCGLLLSLGTANLTRG